MIFYSLLAFVLSLLSFVPLNHAQFIQRWRWIPVQDAQGTWSSKPHWHRQAYMPYQPVLFLQRRVVLEYNCDKMPAICMNANNWMGSAAANWPGRQPNVFTWDIGHSERIQQASPKTYSDARRDHQCPTATWKGTLLNPRCPEPNQPRVVPPLWDANGQGVTALRNPPVNPVTGAFELRIADGRDSQFAGALQESGRIYSCDEFPPASWVEGGVGTVGQNNPEGDGGAGTTFCAPFARECSGNQNIDPHDARGSEQNWQGFIHGRLGAILTAFTGEQYRLGFDYDQNSGIAFLFRTANNAGDPSAARIYYEDNNGFLDNINPGTPFRRRSLEDAKVASNTSYLSPEQLDTADLKSLGFVSVDFMVDDTWGNMTIKLPNGDEIAGDDEAAFHNSINSGITRLGNN